MIPRLSGRTEPAETYARFVDALAAAGFEGDLVTGEGDRVVLSTDNSIYQVMPEAVAYPRGIEDLQRISRLLAEPGFHAIMVRPRGGGTGTNGQSLGPGLIVDCSRHMNRILEIDAEAGWVRVQPGVVKDQLEEALRPYGMFFPPELSTSNRATIGGMISTDACGQGSCLYGKTRDYVLELTTVLPGGLRWASAPLDSAGLAEVQARGDIVGEIHRTVDRVQAENAALIAERFPPLNRCLTGYDLAHIRRADGLFDLNSVLCGSEGTLALLGEARLRIMRKPKFALLVNLRYATFDAALRDAPFLTSFGAASIETVDSTVLGLARQDSIWHEVADCFPTDAEPAQGINLVEFVGDDEGAVRAAVGRLVTALENEGPNSPHLGHTLAEGATIGAVWRMRKKAVGLLGQKQGRRRPVPFVEDTAVPPERLADYIAEFRAILDRRKLDYGMFGHVDAGVLHVRPALDLKTDEDEAMVRAVTEEVCALTAKYGGLLWGEHGKGVRSEFVPQVFGPLYPCLVAIKTAFDPRGQLNPGKIASANDEPLTRIDEYPLRGHLDRRIPEPVRERFDEALHCNGNGACYNYDANDAMCPSWKGTRDRRHSPKGRSALIREWLRRMAEAGADPVEEAAAIRGRSPWQGFWARRRNAAAARHGEIDFSHEVKAAMDGCLACKACSTQCPIRVDVPKFRSKFLELYHGRYGRPLKDYVVAGMEAMLPLAAKAPLLSRIALRNPLSAAVLRGLGLVDAPVPSPQNLGWALLQRDVAIATPERLAGLTLEERQRAVILVQDAFTSYFESELVLDLVELVRALGLTPLVAPFRPNGKPAHVHGFLGAFETAARHNAALLKALADSGIPLVGLDPSMTLTYRSEYADVLSADELPKVRLVQEWLAEQDLSPLAASGNATIRLLPHCTERTMAAAATEAWKTVFKRAGVDLAIVQAGCCGMAGTYGHETRNLETSRRIYDLSWAGHVADGAVLATGYSCRSQVARFGGRDLDHPVSFLLRRARG